MKLDYKAIGQRVRNERNKKGISQEWLAEMADLSVNSVSHIECGNTKFSLPSIVAIANALNITVDCLLMDVIDNSLIQFKRELVEIFNDCSKEEYTLLTDVCKTALSSYRKLQRK